MAIHKKLVWTEHSKIKMRQYGLSKQKIMSILYKPERREKGIVPGTGAVMRTNKKLFNSKQITIKKAWQAPKKAPGEIWVMYKDLPVGRQVKNGERKIISAWRFPGISKPGDEIPVPEDIKNEILNLKF